MEKEMTLQVNSDASLIRLDLYLKRNLPGISRAKIKELIAEGRVHVNGRKIEKGGLLSGGETITIVSTALHPFELMPDPSVPLKIIYEEPSFLIVDKPSGIPTHPLKSGEKGTLANALVARYPELRRGSHDEREAGLVHRLDTATSGLLIVARTDAAHQNLREQFRAGQVTKKYLALVWGILKEEGEIETSFESKGRKKVRVRPLVIASGAKQSPDTMGLPRPFGARNDKSRKTRFKPLAWTEDQTLLEVEIKTGHRHQIRAHLAHLGHPIVGDPVYGGGDQTSILFLHALEISLIHPVQKQRVEFKSFPMENHWKEILTEIKIPT